MLNCRKSWQECVVLVLTVVSLTALFLVAPGCITIHIDQGTDYILPPPEKPQFHSSMDDQIYRGEAM